MFFKALGLGRIHVLLSTSRSETVVVWSEEVMHTYMTSITGVPLLTEPGRSRFVRWHSLRWEDVMFKEKPFLSDVYQQFSNYLKCESLQKRSIFAEFFSAKIVLLGAKVMTTKKTTSCNNM